MQSDWDRSLGVLKYAVKKNMSTKTGMMVGLGESNQEVFDTMKEISKTGVKIFNIGQYLQPTGNNLKVERFVQHECKPH